MKAPEEEAALSDIDRRAAVRFLELLGVMKRFVREEFPPFPDRGMSEAKFRTLLSLKWLGRSHLKLLAAHDGLSSAAQCIMLNRLVEQGFAVRGNDPSDRRRALYELSAGGRREVDGEIARRAELLRERFSRFSNRDRAAFARAIEILLAGISKMQFKDSDFAR